MRMQTWIRRVHHGLMLVLFFFQIVTAYAGNLLPTTQRTTHVALVLGISFLALALRKGNGQASKLMFVALAAASAAPSLYVILNTNQILLRPGLADAWDLAFGVVAILLIMEATRRSVGVPLVVMFGLIVAYALIGGFLPGELGSTGISWQDIVSRLYMTDIGLWGFITGVSASELAAIILFAGFLMALGGVDVLRDAAIVLAGRAVGGSAKVANICSALFGMISGSSPANAATVGNFTIPMMKKAGYTPAFAAAAEAAASTFGQLMPPVMGAAAFVLAELVGIPYRDVMLAAAMPALAVYVAIYAALHFYSVKHGMQGLPAAQINECRDNISWQKSLTVVLPVGLLIALMAIGRTVSLASFWALLLNVALYAVLRPEGWHGWRALLGKYFEGVQQGVQTLVGVAVLLVAAQATVTLINASGLAVIITQGIVGLAHGPVAVALVVAAVTLVLGMGLPTTPAYVIAAAISGPAMLAHGFGELNAHMFIFYFALLSTITPPVCIAVYITAGLAGANWLRTAWHTMMISCFKYVLPFVFLFNSALLFKGTLAEGIGIFLVVILSGVLMEAVVFRYLFSPLGWLGSAFTSLAVAVLVYGGIAASSAVMALGCALGLALMVFNRWRARLPARSVAAR